MSAPADLVRANGPVPLQRLGREGGICLVEDDELVRLAISRSLEVAGFRVAGFADVDSALEGLEELAEHTDVLITDLGMPGRGGLDLLAEARARWPELPVLILTGNATVSVAVEAMRLGAYDYLVKPADAQHILLPTVRRAVEHKRLISRNRFLEGQLQAAQRNNGLVGDSAAMRQVWPLISAAGASEVTVLVSGESGSGKELVARAIHARSARNERVFLDINCAALTDSLLESELFGHVRGAFTGATTARRGLFEAASGGTLFMDEVGELSPSTQARLLRVLQERAVRPVGSSETRRVDVRIIAATNRDLSAEVEAGRFRHDLFYRLNVFAVEVPPLRERREDVAALVDHFLDKHSQRFGCRRPGIDPAVLDLLVGHDWPGNVRELENTIERAMLLCRGDAITDELLPASLRGVALPAPSDGVAFRLEPLAQARRAFQRHYLERVLATANGNLAEAARIAGVDPSNFRKMLRRLRTGTGGDSDGD